MDPICTEIDRGSLRECFHTRLDRSQPRLDRSQPRLDRSQIAFERSRSDDDIRLIYNEPPRGFADSVLLFIISSGSTTKRANISSSKDTEMPHVGAPLYFTSQSSTSSKYLARFGLHLYYRWSNTSMFVLTSVVVIGFHPSTVKRFLLRTMG